MAVLSSSDVEYLTKINRSKLDWYLRTHTERGKDFYYLSGDELKRFKNENPKFSRTVGGVNVVTRSGFVKLCTAYGVKIEEPKCFEQKSELEEFMTTAISSKAMNDYDRFMSLGTSSGKLLKKISDDITSIKVIVDYISNGFHTQSEYDNCRKTIHTIVRDRLYADTSDFKQIILNR